MFLGLNAIYVVHLIKLNMYPLCIKKPFYDY